MFDWAAQPPALRFIALHDGKLQSAVERISQFVTTSRPVTSSFPKQGQTKEILLALANVIAAKAQVKAVPAEMKLENHFFSPIPFVQSPQNAITVRSLTVMVLPHLPQGISLVSRAAGKASASAFTARDNIGIIRLRLSAPLASRTRSSLRDRLSHDHSPSVVVWISPSSSAVHNSMSVKRSKHNLRTQIRRDCLEVRSQSQTRLESGTGLRQDAVRERSRISRGRYRPLLQPCQSCRRK